MTEPSRVVLQLVGDNPDPILGIIWPHRLGQLRAGGDKGVHQVLGARHVWELLRNQHHRAPQSPDRDDESLLPTNQCQLGKIKIILYS